MYLLPDPRLVRLTSTAKVKDGLIEVTVWAVTMMPGLERSYSNVIYSGMISPIASKRSLSSLCRYKEAGEVGIVWLGRDMYLLAASAIYVPPILRLDFRHEQKRACIQECPYQQNKKIRGPHVVQIQVFLGAKC